MVKDQRMVEGDVTCELRLVSHINALAAKTPGLEQYDIKKYAEAFETIPHTLVENTDLDTTSTVSRFGNRRRMMVLNRGSRF